MGYLGTYLPGCYSLPRYLWALCKPALPSPMLPSARSSGLMGDQIMETCTLLFGLLFLTQVAVCQHTSVLEGIVLGPGPDGG